MPVNRLLLSIISFIISPLILFFLSFHIIFSYSPAFFSSFMVLNFACFVIIAFATSILFIYFLLPTVKRISDVDLLYNSLLLAYRREIATNTQTRSLIKNMNINIENERKYIARELHDQLNSYLVSTRLHLIRSNAIINNNHDFRDDHLLPGFIDNAIFSIDGVIAVSRDIISGLRPEVIDCLGLAGAIGELIYKYDAITPQCSFRFHSSGDISSLSDAINIAIYRIVQESITNTVKHARASYVSVFIKNSHDSGIVITITDNGVGFDLTDSLSGSGTGLIGMRERAISFGGFFNLDSSEDGSTIRVSLPI